MAALADWKSATQQVGNLRYECDARIRHRNYVGQHLATGSVRGGRNLAQQLAELFGLVGRRQAGSAGADIHDRAVFGGQSPREWLDRAGVAQHHFVGLVD